MDLAGRLRLSDELVEQPHRLRQGHVRPQPRLPHAVLRAARPLLASRSGVDDPRPRRSAQRHPRVLAASSPRGCSRRSHGAPLRRRPGRAGRRGARAAPDAAWSASTATASTSSPTPRTRISSPSTSTPRRSWSSTCTRTTSAVVGAAAAALHARRRPRLTPCSLDRGATMTRSDRSARPASRSPRSASARGRSAAATGRSAGGRRTTAAPSTRSRTPSELGVSWVDTAADLRPRAQRGGGRPGGAGSARRLPASRLHQVRPRRGTTRDRMKRGAARGDAGDRARAGPRTRCAASASTTSTSSRSTGPTTRATRSSRPGRRCSSCATRDWRAAVGVSNFDVGLLERCEALGHVDSLQPPFSSSAGRPRRSCCRGPSEHGTGVICYSPMKNGHPHRLVQRRSAWRRMAEDDWRRSAPNFREPALGRNLALRDALRPIAERHGTTVAAVAVAWTLAWPGVTRRDRRRPRAGAGGRLDRRGGAGADRRRPRRDRGGDQGDRRGGGADRPAGLEAGPRAAGPAAPGRRPAPDLPSR